MNRLLFACLVLSVIFAAPAPAQESERPIPYPIPRSAAWKKAVDEGTRTDEGHPGSKYWTNYATYVIDAELEPETALVKGHVKVDYVNRSPRSIRDVMVHLRQNLHRAEAVRNTLVEITGGMKIENIKVTVGERSRNLTSDRSSTVWSVRWPKPLEPGATGTIECDFSFTVPRAGRAPRMGHERNHVFFLGYWYPQIAVYEDVEGWVAEPYMGAGEFYMGYGDYTVRFTAPHGWVVQATGDLSNPAEVFTNEVAKLYESARTSKETVHLVTKDMLGRPGAATRESENGKLTWNFESKNVRDVAVAVSDNYLWDASSATVPGKDGPGKDGTCMIHALYEPHARGWTKAVDYLRHTIEFMSEKVYPYPWPHMTGCEGIVGGGMEFPMMTDVGPDEVPQQVASVLSHETIHMWFPMIVGSNEKAWAWMDEGVNTFYTSITQADYWKTKDPQRRAMRDFLFTARGEEYPPMHHSDQFPQGRDGYGRAAYTKPGAVMHQLRLMIGEETFDEAMRQYVSEWAYKHPYPQDLFNTFSRVAETKLDWYFRSWLYEAWLLDQNIESVTVADGRTTIVIEDRGDAPAPTLLRITLDDERVLEAKVGVEHWLSGKRKATIEIEGNATKVELDPDRATLDVSTAGQVWSGNDK